MDDTKPDMSDPGWSDWFAKKMEEPGPREEEFFERMRRVAEVRDELIASTQMVDQDKAAVLLGLSEPDPSNILFRRQVRRQILRFNIEEQAAYPLFQFDVARQRVYPALIEVMKMRPEDWGGQMALLHWLTLPNCNLGEARPCDRLATDADAIIASFEAEISEPLHG
tara:strand:+ start:3262 stop:3762 length:501 start_codon:yes stop_codon:yes gene_type:complete